MATCNLCGGDSGKLNRDGVHNLCAVRAARGAETPSLGRRCPACDGDGYTFPVGWSSINPTGTALARFKCTACNGTGTVA